MLKNILMFVFNFAIIYKVSFEPVPVTKAEQAVDKSGAGVGRVVVRYGHRSRIKTVI
jgi:hypothetical protein